MQNWVEMSKGRKKIPDQVKKLRGTDQPSRMSGSDSIAPFPVLPKPPVMLNKHGVKVFKTLGQYLLNIGLLNEMNLMMFSSLCREYGIYWEAEENMKTLESRYKTFTDKLGNKKTEITAIHMISKEALKLSMKIAVEFGLTPASISKIVFQSQRKKGIVELLD